MSREKFSKRWAVFLTSQTGQNKETEDVLIYAIEILAITVINVVLTLGLGWLLGVFWGTLAGLLTAVLVRHTAGGAHSSSPIRCALITMVVFPALALLAKQLAAFNPFISDLLCIIIIFISLVLIWRFAPAENKAAPIISPQRRRSLRTLSFLAFVIVCICILIIRQSVQSWAADVYVSVALGLMWSTFNLSYPGHSLMLFLDGIISRRR